MTEEGYIKFKAEWESGEPLPEDRLVEINYWRNEMYQRGWIGAYQNGIGFGNISCRWDQANQFVISGSATGNFAQLGPEHYALVKSVDIHNNRLQCLGPVVASSESMSHAVIYNALPDISGVIHIHHLEFWEALLNQVPTTAKEATYGSPEMAYSILDLLKNTNLRKQQIFVMEGHKEGIFAFGKTLEDAADRLNYYSRQFRL